MPPPNKEFSDLPYVSGNALTGVRYISGPGENAGADAPARSGPPGDDPDGDDQRRRRQRQRARRRACRS